MRITATASRAIAAEILNASDRHYWIRRMAEATAMAVRGQSPEQAATFAKACIREARESGRHYAAARAVATEYGITVNWTPQSITLALFYLEAGNVA